MNNKISISIFILFMGMLLFASSGKSSKAVPQNAGLNFDYSPKSSNPPNSADFLLAMVKPRYAVDFAAGTGSTPVFSNFKKSLGGDIEELIIARGFRLKGPYDSRDEMLFSDKENSHMILELSIDPQLKPLGQWKSHGYAAINGYSYSGSLSIQGKINMVGIEPLTGEKIWIKSVEIVPVNNVNIQTQKYTTSNITDEQLMQDPGVSGPVGVALSETYANILGKIEAHLDPREFTSLKPQIRELKKKKGY
jgi:hypothetical protein